MKLSFATRVAAWLLCTVVCQAAQREQPQTLPPPQTTSQTTPTIRVFVNLMQIPVLLLDSNRHPLPPIPPSRFIVNIAGLPPFQPTKVRREGDDPVSLAILVDGDDPGESLWENLGKSSRELTASLRPHDRVEVYGLDGCKMRRFLGDEPFNPEHFREGLENAAAAKPYAGQRKQLGPCPSPVAFWNAMLYVANQLQQRNGRRILLVLSGGHSGSPEVRERLHKFVSAYSITIFGIRSTESETAAASPLSFANGRVLQSSQQAIDRAMVNPGESNRPDGFELQTQAEMSGGMILAARFSNFSKTLATPVELARGRYIVEFPRPSQITAGERAIDVSVGNPHAFIRVAGISVPLATDEETAIDPAVERGVNHPEPANLQQPARDEPGSGSPGTKQPSSTAPSAAPATVATPSGSVVTPSRP